MPPVAPQPPKAEERWVWFAWGQQWKDDRETGQSAKGWAPQAKDTAPKGWLDQSGERWTIPSLRVAWLRSLPTLRLCFPIYKTIMLIMSTLGYPQEDQKEYILNLTAGLEERLQRRDWFLPYEHWQNT